MSEVIMKRNMFEEFEIGQELIDALESLRYFKPTAVQKEVLPLALKQKDVIV
jgi:ATP-dependent RNA helicase DeaD